MPIQFGSKFSQAASEPAVHLLHRQQKDKGNKIGYKLIASKLVELDKAWRFTNQQVRDHLGGVQVHHCGELGPRRINQVEGQGQLRQGECKAQERGKGSQHSIPPKNSSPSIENLYCFLFRIKLDSEDSMLVAKEGH